MLEVPCWLHQWVFDDSQQYNLVSKTLARSASLIKGHAPGTGETVTEFWKSKICGAERDNSSPDDPNRRSMGRALRKGKVLPMPDRADRKMHGTGGSL